MVEEGKDPLRKSCDYCARMKRACDGGSPCSLCCRRGKECTRSIRLKSGPAKGAKYAPRRGKRDKDALSEAAASDTAITTTTGATTPIKNDDHKRVLKRPIVVDATRTGRSLGAGADGGGGDDSSGGAQARAQRTAAPAHRGHWKKQQIFGGGRHDSACGPVPVRSSLQDGRVSRGVAGGRAGARGQNMGKDTMVAAGLSEVSLSPTVSSKPSPCLFSRESEEEEGARGVEEKVVPVLQHKRRGKKRPSSDAAPSSSPLAFLEKEGAGAVERRDSERQQRPPRRFSSGDGSVGEGRGRVSVASDDNDGGGAQGGTPRKQHQQRGGGDDESRACAGSAKRREGHHRAGSRVHPEEKTASARVSSSSYYSSPSLSSSSSSSSSFSPSSSPGGAPSPSEGRAKRRRVPVKVEAVASGEGEISAGAERDRQTQPASKDEEDHEGRRHSWGWGKLLPPQASAGREGREGLAELWGACRTVSPLSEEEDQDRREVVPPRVRAWEPNVTADGMDASYYFRTHMGLAAQHKQGRLHQTQREQQRQPAPLAPKELLLMLRPNDYDIVDVIVNSGSSRRRASTPHHPPPPDQHPPTSAPNKAVVEDDSGPASCLRRMSANDDPSAVRVPEPPRNAPYVRRHGNVADRDSTVSPTRTDHGVTPKAGVSPLGATRGGGGGGYGPSCNRRGDGAEGAHCEHSRERAVEERQQQRWDTMVDGHPKMTPSEAAAAGEGRGFSGGWDSYRGPSTAFGRQQQQHLDLAVGRDGDRRGSPTGSLDGGAVRGRGVRVDGLRAAAATAARMKAEPMELVDSFLEHVDGGVDPGGRRAGLAMGVYGSHDRVVHYENAIAKEVGSWQAAPLRPDCARVSSSGSTASSSSGTGSGGVAAAIRDQVHYGRKTITTVRGREVVGGVCGDLGVDARSKDTAAAAAWRFEEEKHLASFVPLEMRQKLGLQFPHQGQLSPGPGRAEKVSRRPRHAAQYYVVRPADQACARHDATLPVSANRDHPAEVFTNSVTRSDRGGRHRPTTSRGMPNPSRTAKSAAVPGSPWKGHSWSLSPLSNDTSGVATRVSPAFPRVPAACIATGNETSWISGRRADSFMCKQEAHCGPSSSGATPCDAPAWVPPGGRR